ncbi:helix-turn-helix transcriptional regulator [Paraburkholderia aspalathi]|uniref:Transcriptional regulator, AraC family n=1 Tax=Paraburkholderia aspalathi TaxID=1324617 RepID=A0A1I7EPN8_9BURK|nr:AraC family transcriptional regulator [Paraburkholderia aspalathi]SFU25900.1 transcriptional regulator, AraC family [Paraburkholderia aspalathi]
MDIRIKGTQESSAPERRRLTPSKTSLVQRPGLYSFALPSIHSKQVARSFLFFDVTLMVVLRGRLQVDDVASVGDAGFPKELVCVAEGVCADVLKEPAETEGAFRSIFLAISSDVLIDFFRMYPDFAGGGVPLRTCRKHPLDKALLETFRHCIRGLSQGNSSSEAELRHRLMGLLLGLATRGIVFQRPDGERCAERVRLVVQSDIASRWTAKSVGERLAMSEATLRRKLAAEGLQFKSLLSEVRMHHAMALVQTTQWSIQRISEACGYDSTARFSARFRSRFGRAPSTMR